MFAMNLVDALDKSTNYGILFCENDNITEKMIQKKICEIKGCLEEKGIDWVVSDVITHIPAEWKVYSQKEEKKIVI